MGESLNMVPVRVTQEQRNAFLSALDQRFSRQPDPRSSIDEDRFVS